MRVAVIASEVVPFSKTGGLGDVIGALPPALAELGEEVVVISPLYRMVRENAEELGVELARVSGIPLSVPVGDLEPQGAIVHARLPGCNVDFYFLENDRYYDRAGLYNNPHDHKEYQDNSERFIFLSRGSLELIKALDLKSHVLHCHDWQTGLVPIYRNTLYEADFKQAGTAFTVHNLAYQGLFWHWDMKLTGLPWELFNWRVLEYYGNLSFLKAGLVGAHALTTVSQTYSREIQTEEFGAGLEGVLRERAHDLYGIVNGVDYCRWNPATDALICCHYSEQDLSGKQKCKTALQEEFGLRQDGGIPLIGMIGRLAEQKGLDLLAEAFPSLVQRDVQVVILGTGETRYKLLLERLQRDFPGRIAIRLEFSEETAHRIEAGCDMLLIPSRFEPCGLNQIYSMKYGTVPIVRAVGGLADTVTDYTEKQKAGRATGFSFTPYTKEALLGAVDRALELYEDKESWHELMRMGMREDWSWKRSAAEYVKVYRKALEKACVA